MNQTMGLYDALTKASGAASGVTELARFNASGNLLIGRTTDIISTAKLQLSDGTINSLYGYKASGTEFLGTHSNHPLSLITNNVARLTISAAGTVTVDGALAADSVDVNTAALATGAVRAWTATDTDIDGLIGGSTNGVLFEGAGSAHFTVGLRSNDVGDGFQVISKQAGNATYTLKCFEAKADGSVSWRGRGTVGALRAIDPLDALGYGTGAGGTVTQTTSKSTPVVLNKPCGQITMNNAALATSTSVSFTLTNSLIAATDVVRVSIASGATAGAYSVTVDATAAGSCRISVRNHSGGSLSEALVLNFAVLKAVSA